MENDINKIKEDIEHIICSNNEHSNLIIDITPYPDGIIDIIITSKDAFKIKPIVKYLKNNKFYIKKSTLPENGPIESVTNYIITGTFHKNLLIVGNGFDIAHGLNTQYTDFLNVCSKDRITINNHEYIMKCNPIYLYLKEQKNKNGYWTDVEKAITNIIKSLEKIKMTFIDNNSYYKSNLNTLLDKKINSILNTINFFPDEKQCAKKFPLEYTFTNNDFYKFIKKLEYNLDYFINALEDYLLEIENTPINKPIYLNDIDNIKDSITHILSFNYTNTFRRLYVNDISNEYIDFIHGRLGEHNLVLGISETLPTEEENIELSCIYFKKYFQRIFKKTGAKYADWLDDKNGTNFDTVYIYGHSLDITDKEILSRIINDVNHVKKIVIFYHNKEHYRQEISNLVKILDKNTFLKYVAEHRIEFKEQTS